MKGFLALASIVAAAFVVAPLATADDVVPFPAAHSGDVFVVAQTVTADRALMNHFAPGSAVIFRAYAVDGKTHKFLTKKNTKYFYVTIPNQPNVKLKYNPKAPGTSGRYVWTGVWNVPADYPTGVVKFKVLARMKSKRLGSFVQVPVASSQLTITTTPQTPLGSGPSTAPISASKVSLGLYVDTVNGTRPAGAKPRPIGCTQTNVFKRGEQVVVRSWGFDLTSGEVLSMDNVSTASFSLAGVPSIKLNWGAHGATGAKVWFWTNFWQIPADYPLGDAAIHVSFTTVGGKTETFDYIINVIP